MTGALRKSFRKTQSANETATPPATDDPETEDVIEEAPAASQPHNMLEMQYEQTKESFPKRVRDILDHEFQRLNVIGSGGHEYGSTLDYVGTLIRLPWEKKPHRRVSLKTAEQKLNSSHYGMQEVKDRAIEFIAALNNGGKSGGIVCLDGPAGVGKTSIAHAIAHAMGRKCIKISMAGVNDQTLLRGFARTYSGAQPGVIVQAMKKAGVTNPVIVLDEGDKAGGSESNKGNVTFAMLELLDPQQNKEFKDHYLNLEYDMSDVVFIMTTNNVHALPTPLVDRMEIISLRPYTAEEKLEIARRHLVPRHLEDCGLSERQLRIKDDALQALIDDYTEEAGVRGLEKQIRKICRRKNVAFQRRQAKSASVSASALETVIGPPRIYKKRAPEHDSVGTVTGLYFADDVGGGILPLQAALRPASEFKVTVTGMAGKMIDESARYATEMLQYLAERYHIDKKKLAKTNVHIHMPDAGQEKDGPSAGIAISTALISALKNIKVRHDVAMTGEVDLFGNVGPIGGLMGKLEGARRAGITTVLIPSENVRDLIDVPDSLKAKLTIIPVSHVDEVFAHALTEALTEPEVTAGNHDGQDKLPSAEDIQRVIQFIAQAAQATTPVSATAAPLPGQGVAPRRKRTPVSNPS